jgi:hypothetical protein
MGQTVADRSSNEADNLCILLYLAWRLWKRVVTLAMTRNTFSGRSFLFHRVPKFYRHRLLLTGSRCYIQWLIDRQTKPIFCVFPVLSVAVMGRCCDACRDWEYYFRSIFRPQRLTEFHWHRLPLTGSRWDIRWLIGRRTKPTFCVFCCI